MSVYKFESAKWGEGGGVRRGVGVTERVHRKSEGEVKSEV